MDDEIKGDGNSVNYKYRMHDPRLGRFFAVDPLAKEYSYNSPYAFSENVVINANELEGLEIVYNYVFKPETKKFVFTYKSIDQGLNENVNRYVYFNNTGGIGKQIYQGVESKKKYVAASGQVDKFSLYQRFNQFENFDTRSGPDATHYDSWMGNDDGAGLGGKLGGEKGWDNGGKQLFFGTVGIVTAPISFLAASSASGVAAVWGYATATVSTINAVDDVGGLVVSSKKPTYNSLLESLSSDPSYKNNVRNTKALGTVITFTDFESEKNIERNARVFLEKDFLSKFQSI
jgi:hypothetical protein